MSEMDDWLRRGANRNRLPANTTAERTPTIGHGAGEGGARGSLPTPEPSVDAWLRASARGGSLDQWQAALDDDARALMDVGRGHPDPATGRIN